MLLVLTLSAGPTEEFFFEYPRKALTEFLQSWKAKNQPPKSNSIQHHHVHYYPLPLTLLGWTKAPDKRELDALYKDSLTSYGWTDYRYKFSPDPSIIVSSNFQLWSDTDPRNLEIVDETAPKDIRATIDRAGILVRVPVNQQFVIHLLKKRKLEQKETAI
ncbi:hypothetical protein HN011_002748 [Eciton burchellii]|nr:hypothetical protein HN011_002748 [Eciton burchellii]